MPSVSNLKRRERESQGLMSVGGDWWEGRKWSAGLLKFHRTSCLMYWLNTLTYTHSQTHTETCALKHTHIRARTQATWAHGWWTAEVCIWGSCRIWIPRRQRSLASCPLMACLEKERGDRLQITLYQRLVNAQIMSPSSAAGLRTLLLI